MSRTRRPQAIPIGRAKVWIGTSGWIYPHWKGRFYPEDLPQSQWFAYYSQFFPTVEINNTFYQLPAEQTFDHWARQAPAGFRYAVKANRFLTHIKRLQGIEEPLERFMSRALRLGKHLGPVLFQLPPRWKYREDRLKGLLLALSAYRPRKFAVEVRDPDWLREDAYRLLGQHRVALCVHDLLPEHPRVLTARFTYLRFHGAGELYGGCYSDEALLEYASWIVDCALRGVSVYAYFNNDAYAYATQNALTLMAQVAALVGNKPVQRG